MYTPVLDRELKRVDVFKLETDYYVKNGNGCWYKGQLKNLDTLHTVHNYRGTEKRSGRWIEGEGIHQEQDIFELDETSSLELPDFPEFFIFGEKEIKTEDLKEREIELILRRWKETK